MDEKIILNVIRDWNYDYVFKKRKHYSEQIKSLAQSKEVIALIGVRRSGKSTLLYQEISNLKKIYDSSQILFLNFEDPRFSTQLNTSLLDEIFEVYKKNIYRSGEIFLFLDEIQNIPDWEKWVRTKHELKQANIYITGSSAKLLSKELGTVLTGRCLEVNVFPLSFNEYLEFTNEKKLVKIDSFNSYFEFGGFPKVVNLLSNKKEELQAYFKNIILRDVVARYSLKNYHNVEQIAQLLISNVGKLYSANKLRLAIGISLESALFYIEALKESMLFFDLYKFDYSLKKQQLSQKKIYCIDSGMINTLAFNFSENKGRVLENLVFIELKRRNKKIYYHKNKFECDFLIKQGLKITEAVQVCYELTKENKKRELAGLLEAMDEHKLKKGLLLTYDKEEELIFKNKKIVIMPVWKYLLNE